MSNLDVNCMKWRVTVKAFVMAATFRWSILFILIAILLAIEKNQLLIANFGCESIIRSESSKGKA